MFFSLINPIVVSMKGVMLASKCHVTKVIKNVENFSGDFTFWLPGWVVGPYVGPGRKWQGLGPTLSVASAATGQHYRAALWLLIALNSTHSLTLIVCLELWSWLRSLHGYSYIHTYIHTYIKTCSAPFTIKTRPTVHFSVYRGYKNMN